MPAPGHVTVDDVDPGAVVELGILQAVGRVQLAVGAGRVVEQLGEGPHDMVVVVEDLVVVPGWTTVPPHEQRLGIVDHDPHRSVRGACLPS